MRLKHIFAVIYLSLFLAIPGYAQRITNHARPDGAFAAGSVASVDDVRMVEDIFSVPVREEVYEARGSYVTVDGVRARLTSVGPSGAGFIMPAIATGRSAGRLISMRRANTANVAVHTESGAVFNFTVRFLTEAPGFYPGLDGRPAGFQFVNGYQFLDYNNVIPASRGLVQISVRVNGFVGKEAYIVIGPYKIPVTAYPDPVFAGYENAIFTVNGSVLPGVYDSHFIIGRDSTQLFPIVIQ